MARPRLTAVLDEWSPVTGVWGLAGYGKTALVASWLEALDPDRARVLTVTASPTPGSPASGTTVASIDRDLLRTLSPHGTAPSAALTHPGLDALDHAAHHLDGGRRLLLVIDDAQFATDPQWLLHLLRLLRRHRDLHLVLCSWGRHELLDLAAGRVDCREIAPSDLLLTPAEISQLALLLGHSLTEAERNALHTAFGGWFAPTRLALDARAGAVSGPRVGEQFLRLHVLPALEQMGCCGLDLALRLSLAAAPHLDAALVEQVAAEHHPAALPVLLNSGVLHREPDTVDAGYQFAAAVGDVLRREFETRQPDEAAAFHQWLGRWHARRAAACDDAATALLAFRHSVLGADWAHAHRVWVLFESRFSMHHPADYLQALSAIPDDVLAEHPAWQVARTAMRTAVANQDGTGGGMAVIVAHLQAADQARFDPNTLPLHDLLYLGTYRLVYRRLHGHRAADDYGAALHKIVDDRLKRGEVAGDRLAFFLLQRGNDKLMLGEDATAIRHYLDAARVPLQSTAPHHTALAGSSLALSYAMRGDRDRATDALSLYRKWVSPDTWGHRMISAPAVFAEGMLALDQLDQAGARAALDELGDGRGPEPIWPFICYLHAQYALHYGDPQAALTLVANARAKGDHQYHEAHRTFEETGNPILLVCQAELLVALGKAQQARHLLRDADPRHPALARTLALAELAAGRDTQARTALTVVAHRPIDARQHLQLALIDAAAAHSLGDHNAVHSRLRQINQLYETTGILRAFTRIPTSAADTLLDLVGTLTPADQVTLRGARNPFPSGQATITLSRRERDLAHALTNNRTRQQIADDLYLSINTVKKQITSLYRKLDANKREQALHRIHELGLLN